jgi:asparagine synthase (glutamine-hydrolysing)
MCGFVGVAQFRSAQLTVDLERCGRASAAISHRGPDGDGEWRGPHAWISHRRLAIMDLAPRSNQPMVSARTGSVLAYNGELYNFRELRALFPGHIWETESDTEVMQVGLDRFGEGFLDRVNGIFAISHLSRSGDLILARDRLGVKPLFYSERDHGISFASEIQALLELESGRRAVDISALREWLFRGTWSSPHTLYAGLKQVPAGASLRFNLNEASVSTRSTAPYAIEPFDSDDSRHPVQAVWTRLREAVSRQLMSDVPLAVFLSGGVDSSAIAAAASEAMAGEALTTLTARFGTDNSFDTESARATATKLGAKHREIELSDADLASTHHSLIRSHGGPFSDPAGIPLAALSRAIAAETKVVLQGDGGDELFGGYRRHRMLPLLASNTRQIAASLFGRLARPPAGSLPARWQRAAEALLSATTSEALARLMNEVTPTEGLEFFAPALREELLTRDPFRAYELVANQSANHSVYATCEAFDLRVTLPELFLPKVDRATMLGGVEARVPLLDDAFVSFVLTIPPELRFQGKESKWLLREAIRGRVPDAVLRGRKRGFSTPIARWLMGPLRMDFIDAVEQVLAARPGVLDGPRCRSIAMLEHHDDASALRAWRLYSLCTWLKHSSARF